MFILMYTFLVSQFLDITRKVEDFIKNFYVSLASVVSCSKMLSLLDQKNIIMLIHILEKLFSCEHS